MRTHLRGHDVLIATGTGDDSIAPDAKPIILLHGAGMDRTVWALQCRKLAHAGFAPYAVDLPGHGGSAGEPLTSISEMAEWSHELMRALGHSTYAAVGHSMGGLVALEMMQQQQSQQHSPGHCLGAALVGVCDRLAVSPALLESAETAPAAAAAMIVDWSFAGKKGGRVETPGVNAMAQGKQLIRAKGLRALAGDLKACVAYGELASHWPPHGKISLLLGSKDRMTPPKMALSIRKLADEEHIFHAGHMVQAEAADDVRQALMRFLASLFPANPSS